MNGKPNFSRYWELRCCRCSNMSGDNWSNPAPDCSVWDARLTRARVPRSGCAHRRANCSSRVANSTRSHRAVCNASVVAKGRRSQARSATHGECSKTQPRASTKPVRVRELMASIVMGLTGDEAGGTACPTNGHRRQDRRRYGGHRRQDRRRYTLLYRPEDALRGSGAVERDHAAWAEGCDGVADGLARGDGQHQRGLADGLAAKNHARLGGPFQERHLAHAGQFRPRGQLVGGGPVGGCASLAVPQQLFEGEPAKALDVAAFDLAAIDQRGKRIAHVLEDVHPQPARIAGEPVHLHFGDSSAISEIVERMSAPGLLVEVDPRGAVVACGE